MGGRPINRPPNLAKDAAPFPSKKYSIIYADPPWKYDDARDHASAGMALSSYPCMETAEIAKLRVPDLAGRQCQLVMWATWPKLPDALEVMRAWGFRYQTVGWVWVKTSRASPRDARLLTLEVGADFRRLPPGTAKLHRGTGHFTQANTEYAMIGFPADDDVEVALLGRMGKALERMSRSVPQVVFAPLGRRHSEKPPEVRDAIVELFGDLPRIELFARESGPGWDAWGNQLGSSNQVLPRDLPL
jgi:N6-adenosine-specific RNA methylase IME4